MYGFDQQTRTRKISIFSSYSPNSIILKKILDTICFFPNLIEGSNDVIYTSLKVRDQMILYLNENCRLKLRLLSDLILMKLSFLIIFYPGFNSNKVSFVRCFVFIKFCTCFMLTFASLYFLFIACHSTFAKFRSVSPTQLLLLLVIENVNEIKYFDFKTVLFLRCCARSTVLQKTPLGLSPRLPLPNSYPTPPRSWNG